jgi:hypothetical protein
LDSCFLGIVFQVKGYHGAVGTHLVRRQVMVRVVFEAGIKDSVYLWVVTQEMRDLQGILARSFHPEVEGLDASYCQKAVLRAGYSTTRVLDKGQLFVEFFRIDSYQTHDDIGVPSQIFRGRVHDHVSSKIQRILKVGRGKGVVHASNDTKFPGNSADGLDIHHCEHGIGGRLDPDQFGLLTDG